MGFELKGYRIITKKTVDSFGDLLYDWDSRQNIQTSAGSGQTRVIKWIDRANGKSLNRITEGATAPLYNPSYHNGIPALQFDGVDDYIRGLAAPELRGIAKTTFVLVSKYGAFGQMGLSTNNRFGLSADATVPAISALACSGANTNGQFNVTESSPSIRVMVFDGTQATNATRLKMYRNKSLLSMTYVGTIPALTDTVGTWIQMGIAGASVYRQSDIMRGIIYKNTALTQAQVEELTDLINSEYLIF